MFDIPSQVVIIKDNAMIITNVVKDKDLPVAYPFGKKYIEMLKGMSSSPHTKIFLLSGDLQAAIREIFGNLRM